MFPPDSDEEGGSADDIPIDQAAPKAPTEEPVAASEPSSTEEEMTSTMAVINAVVVDD